MPEKPLQVRLEATDQRPGQFTLTFNSSQYPLTLNPESSSTFSEWLRRLRPVLMGQNDPAGEFAPQALLRNVGMWLWQALLPEGAPALERDTLAQALRTGRTPLLLALPNTLSGLPWELLCDPQQSGEKGFLARRRPLMRFHAFDTLDTPVSPFPFPLRVLLLISSPPGLGEDSRVDVESERAAVEQATRTAREKGKLHLLVEDIVTLQRVQDALLSFQPHIVHFIGHGGYDAATGGVLLWEDERGNALQISDGRLAEILCPRNLHAVVLHACQTGRSDTRTDVLGVAGTLVNEGIPTVLAQQANFTYESSQRASKAWYTTLTTRRGFAEALFEVRQALALADRPDWAVPILQGTSATLAPMLDATALLGPPDPLLTGKGAAADLPTPTGVFVGRHAELRTLRLMLENAPGNGPVLALITGPGGVGKSTLAAQAVTRSGGKYKAALTLSCQGYQSVELFLQRLGEFLKRLGVPGFLELTLPDPKLSTEAKIEGAIAALNAVGPVLLVVDNLESAQHEDQTLRDASLLHLLQKLFTNLRGGRVLITGRYAVKDLLPQGKFAAHLLRLDLDDLSPYETNQLVARHPTLAHLGETVRQMLIDEFGGLPYVYDLLSSDAASQSLDLLVHDVQGRITKERKQRSTEQWQAVRRQVVEFAALEATISRLSESSRTLLVHLSVLHQFFPLAAIEQGLGAVRAAWQPLLDWSLLRYDSLEQSYRLHSITRRYAENLLNEHDRTQTQAQLALWYEHYADWESHDLADYLEAHRLFRAAGDGRQAGKLVMRLVRVLVRNGYYSLLRELCITALRDIGESEEWLTAGILHSLGILEQHQGEYEEARRLYQQSLEIKERLDNQRGRAATLNQLGVIAQDQGEYEEARQLYQQSLEISERLGDQELKATTLNQLGMIAQDQGEYEEARRLYQQNLEISERLGDQELKAAALHQLGMIARGQGEYEEARRLYQQSLEISERLGNQSGRASALHGLGSIVKEQGEYEEARRLYQQSLEISERLGDQSGRASALHSLGSIVKEQGEYEEARRLCQQSLEIKERLGDQSGRAATLNLLGVIARNQGEYEEARRLYQQSLEISERLGNQSGRASALHNLGMIAQDQGEYEKAKRLCQQSLEISERLGDQSGRAATLNRLGLIAQDQGEYEKARQLYQQSLEISERLGDQSTRANALHNLGRVAQDQGDYEKARQLYQQSLEVNERLGDLRERAISLYQLGRIAYLQGDFEKALIYTIQTYVVFDSLRSPLRDSAQGMIAIIRRDMDETTFVAYWRAIAGDRPLVVTVEQEETQDTDKDNTLTVEQLSDHVSSLILRGTVEQRLQFAAHLVEAQQQLPPEEAALGRLFDCLAAALRGETPEVALLEAPFTDVWQAFQDALRAALGEESQRGEWKHG